MKKLISLNLDHLPNNLDHLWEKIIKSNNQDKHMSNHKSNKKDNTAETKWEPQALVTTSEISITKTEDHLDLDIREETKFLHILVGLDHKEDLDNKMNLELKVVKEHITHLWEKTKMAEANLEEKMSSLLNEKKIKKFVKKNI